VNARTTRRSWAKTAFWDHASSLPRKLQRDKRRLGIERLEPRLLLSADALAPLALTLSDGADDVTLLLDETSDLLRIVDNNTSAVVAEQLLAETSEVVIDAGHGKDRLKLDTSLPDSLTVRFDGGEGADTLVGPDVDTAWRVTGLDSGLVDGTRFTNVENLEGAADNEDTFVIGAYGALSGVVEGGDGGFDTVEFTGWRFDEVTAIATGPDSGVVDRDGSQVFYSGMEPVNLDIVAADFVFEVSANPFSSPGTTDSADEIVLRNVAGAPGQMERDVQGVGPVFTDDRRRRRQRHHHDRVPRPGVHGRADPDRRGRRRHPQRHRDLRDNVPVR
jgi:hypothetical protein